MKSLIILFSKNLHISVSDLLEVTCILVVPMVHNYVCYLFKSSFCTLLLHLFFYTSNLSCPKSNISIFNHHFLKLYRLT
jgi:hypothetical protein